MVKVRPAHTRTTAASRQPLQRSRWDLSLRIGLILLSGALTYWNSLGGPFVFDDRTAIERNETIRRLWPLSGVLSAPRETPVGGRPVVNLSLAINYAIGGLHPASYHLWNIAVHLVSAVVLFGLVRRTLLGPRLRARVGPTANNLALASALLWMLHPLHSEVVDYITQRTESMMGLFFLLTLYCAARARHAVRATRWQMATVLSCALGMASKESMATAPLMVVLYDRVFEFDSWREAWRTRWRLYAALATTWLGLVGLIWSGPRASTVGLSAGIDPRIYLLNQFDVITQYLRLTFWPRALVFDYGLPKSLALLDVMPQAMLVVALLVATAIALARWPTVGFLGAWFFLTLAPTSSVIPIATEVGAERRMYLPLASLAVLAAIAGRLVLDRLGRRFAGTSSSRGVWVGRCVTAGVLIALAVRTVYRNTEYATSISLWRTVVDRRPHARARYSLALELRAAGFRDEAMAELRRAAPELPDAEYGIGTELFEEGKFDDAIEHLHAFIRRRPEAPDAILAHDMIGRAYAAQGKLSQAVEQFRRMLKTAPSNADVHGNLADALLAQGQFNEAIVHYRVLVSYRPDEARALTNFGAALAAAGQLEEAIERFQRALQVEPQSGRAHRQLADAWLRRGNAGQAEVHAREALRIEPRDSLAHNLLGVALASQGKVDEAIHQFQRSLQINPNDPKTQQNLALALQLKDSRPRVR